MNNTDKKNLIIYTDLQFYKIYSLICALFLYVSDNIYFSILWLLLLFFVFYSAIDLANQLPKDFEKTNL